MRHIIFSFCILLLSWQAHAHGPTPQKAKESLTIQAPIAKVWAELKNFDDIANWHTDLKKSAGDGKNQSGGVRTLTFQNDEVITEELDYYNEAEHEYSYRLKAENTKAVPTSSHTVDVKVVVGETPDSSVVTVKSRFYRGDTGNTPPENLNDEAAVKAMTQFFKNGLNGLKAKLEK
ncbi:MxaD protein [Methylomonas albis]|uniref:SRPBCC family protein n=1 Tax=Methylomonas albis TaxID=1854563 RepID=A0ABR9D029_9GAMM|nr:SRPBCC family protein [Methylomonas albis]MBD9356491.1 SRPBCC family protein [Methylomonas albis]CAD6879600.1 MxaD protein [Methylomonas albis]